MVQNGDLRKTVQELLVEIAVLRTRLEEKDKALHLQAGEYERRLDILNNSHADATETLKQYGSTYLTIDRFDRFMNDEHTPWRRKVDEILTTNQSNRAAWISLFAVLFALLSIALQGWDAVIRLGHAG